MRPGSCTAAGLLAAALVAAPAAADPADPVPVPYRLTDTKHVMVRVKLNGTGPYNLILDTGAPSVFITKKVAAAGKVRVGDDGWAELKSFDLEGGLAVPKTRVRVADLFQLDGMNGMGLAGVELHGVIGYNVLAQYRITYDFTADKLLFAKLDFTPPAVKASGKDNSQGTLDLLGPVMKTMAAVMGIKPDFTLTPRGSLGVETAVADGKVVVKSVVSDSPAAAAGVKPGDTLAAVAVGKPGKKPGALTDIDGPADLTRALAKAGPGQAAKLQVVRGGETLTLSVTLGKGF